MKHPYNLTDILGFGKYRYRQLKYVLQRDANYIHWCMNNIQDFELSEDALKFAQSCSKLFVPVKPEYDYQPYVEGIDILKTCPWKKQHICYMRKYAEDTQAISIDISHQPKQLTLW